MRLMKQIPCRGKSPYGIFYIDTVGIDSASLARESAQMRWLGASVPTPHTWARFVGWPRARRQRNGGTTMTQRCRTALLLAAIVALAGCAAPAENIVYPAGALAPAGNKPGVWDVTRPPPGLPRVDNAGKTDVTQALIQYLTLASKVPGPRGGRGPHNIVYLPNGVYRISGTLTYDGPERKQWQKLHIQGQSRADTVIRLADNCPGFTDPAVPRGVLDLTRVSNPGNNNQDCTVRNLTIDVGSGNAGAIGIDWCANNMNGLERVAIRSSGEQPLGRVGFRSTFRASGGGLAKHLRIDGFDIGIETGGLPGYHYEWLELAGIREAGIRHVKSAATVRKLSFHAAGPNVPAVVLDGEDAVMVLLDSTFEGRAGSAIQLRNGWLYARDVESSGFQNLLVDRTRRPAKTVSGPRLGSEYVSGPVLHAGFPGQPLRSLGLPIEETPELPWDPPEQWLSVTDFGAVPDDGDDNGAGDDTAAVQAAIDATANPSSPHRGKTTLYFPGGLYRILHTIQVRGSIRRVHFLFSRIRHSRAAADYADGAVFCIRDGAYDTVLFHDYSYGNTTVPFIRNRSARTVVLKHLAPRAALYTADVPGARVYIENCTAHTSDGDGLRIVGDIKVWARWYDPEGSQPHRKLYNDGGTIWVLGYKIGEMPTDSCDTYTLNGGRTELLGGLMNRCGGHPPSAAPMHRVDDAHFAFVGLERDAGGSNETIVRETRDGRTRELGRAALPARPGSRTMPGEQRARIFPLVVAHRPGNPE
ncbi:MAG: hypothetical protein JXR37_33775 [Kiritimatiellae bacterium]|nr:hypothetical protein [Kiritimatiellia bacterium]